MALGTPVDGGAAYSAQNGTTVSPGYPVGIQANDCLVLIVGMKPSTANGGTITTPTGWTLREAVLAQGGYGTGLAADTGNTNLWIFTKDVVNGSETGNLTVTIGTNNVSWGLIVNIPTDAGTLSYGTADGSRATAPTSGTPFTTLLTNGASAPNFKAGDMALWAMCIPTDVLANGFTAPTISSTGTTFGTAVELEEPDSGTGNDIGGYVAYASATTGTSTAAPTVGVTATGTVTNVRGPIALLRITEIAALNLNAEPTSYSVTGVAATLLENKHLTAEPDSYAVTGVDASLARQLHLTAEPSSYSLTGANATLLKDRNLNAESASYVLTGNAVTFEIAIPGKNLDAEPTSYAITGSNAELDYGRVVNAEPGSYSVTGSTAQLIAGLFLNAEFGNYSVSGFVAEFSNDKDLNAQAGSYNVTGNAAEFMLSAIFNAETGAYVISGNIADFLKDYDLAAETGAYDITGENAELSKTGDFVADAGDYNITGFEAALARDITLNAEPATEYVEPGYVDPGYVIQTGYYVNGFSVTFNYPRYPLPNEVLAGVLYGPNGDDYVGTYVCPPGTSKQILYIFDD